jgi:hypothetical protein
MLADAPSSSDPLCPARRRLLAAPLLAVVPARATPAPAPSAPLSDLPGLPDPRTLDFRIYYGDASRDMAVAEVAYRLAHGDGRYRLATDGHATGVVALFYSGNLTQTSQGRVTSAGLVPERYTERRGRRPERTLVFDRARGRLIGPGDPADIALPPGTQDRLSVFFQLGLLARGRSATLAAGHRFTMPLAAMRRVDRPTFTTRGPDAVKTSRGPLDAVRISIRNEDDPEDPVFDVWLAPTLDMLPVRVRMQESDGKVIDQVLIPSG